MAYGVEEYNEEKAQAKFKAGFSGAPSATYNSPPQITFVDGYGPNAKKIHGVDSPSMNMSGPGEPYMARKNK